MAAFPSNQVQALNFTETEGKRNVVNSDLQWRSALMCAAILAKSGLVMSAPGKTQS